MAHCVLSTATVLHCTESGTLFAWGSNAAGQLGRAPLEPPDPGRQQTGDGRVGPVCSHLFYCTVKVVVMKTSKRIIRLQQGLQNSCDLPRPVPGKQGK